MKQMIAWRYTPLIMALALLVFLGRGLFLDSRGQSDARVGTVVHTVRLPVWGGGPNRQIPGDLDKPLALLHVWATWCGACRAEALAWAELMEQVPDHVARIGVLYKDSGDEAGLWLQRFGNPYDWIVLDQRGDLSMELGVYGTPETYLLDRSGRILAKHVGRMRSSLWQSTWLPLMQEAGV